MGKRPGLERVGVAQFPCPSQRAPPAHFTTCAAQIPRALRNSIDSARRPRILFKDDGGRSTRPVGGVASRCRTQVGNETPRRHSHWLSRLSRNKGELPMIHRHLLLVLTLIALTLSTGCCCRRCCWRPLFCRPLFCRPCCRPACCEDTCCYGPGSGPDYAPGYEPGTNIWAPPVSRAAPPVDK